MQILTPGLHQIYRFCLRFRDPQSEDRVTGKVTDKVTSLTEPFFFVHDVHDVGNKNRSIGNMNSWQICGRDKNIESSNKSRRKIISTLASRYIALKVKNVFFLYPEQSRFITRCCFVWPLKMRWSCVALRTSYKASLSIKRGRMNSNKKTDTPCYNGPRSWKKQRVTDRQQTNQ